MKFVDDDEVDDKIIAVPSDDRHNGDAIQSLEDLPAINPVQVEDFKAEAEEEVELRLNV